MPADGLSLAPLVEHPLFRRLVKERAPLGPGPLRRASRPLLPLFLLPWACSTAAREEAREPLHGAVSANTPEATRAGLDILSQGGNAVDAAVAVSLTLGVTEPAQSGLGGRVLMVVRPPGADPVVIHVPPSGPGGEGNPASAMPPTALRVLHHAWTRYGSGRVSWEEIFAPAIRAASDGFPLGAFSHQTLVKEYHRVLADSAATSLLLRPDRSIPSEGSPVRNPELAAVLERVAQEGPEGFYAGEVGARLAAALSARGVPLSPERLASTPAAVETPALSGSFAGRAVWVPGDPYGGPFVLSALRFLELAPPQVLRSPGWSRAAWLAEAMAYAQSGGGAAPVTYLSALPPMPLPRDTAAAVRPLTGLPPSAAAPPRRDVQERGPEPPSRDVRERGMEPRPRETSHFSVADGSGTAVSVTQTLGAPFGAGAALPGLGFFYQGEPPAVAGTTAPAGPRADSTAAPRPRSSAFQPLAPTIVTRGARVELVLGSPGGEPGLAAVVQVLADRVRAGVPLADAVDALRLYVGPGSPGARGRVLLEGVVWDGPNAQRRDAYAAWGDSVDARLRGRGLVPGERDQGPLLHGRDAWFGGVNALAWTEDGWAAAGDARRDGVGGIFQDGAQTLEAGTRFSPEPSVPES